MKRGNLFNIIVFILFLLNLSACENVSGRNVSYVVAPYNYLDKSIEFIINDQLEDMQVGYSQSGAAGNSTSCCLIIANAEDKIHIKWRYQLKEPVAYSDVYVKISGKTQNSKYILIEFKKNEIVEARFSDKPVYLPEHQKSMTPEEFAGE